jgi:hypothetical protein
MLRYYMTADTRDWIITESQRMIAARAAARAAQRNRSQALAPAQDRLDRSDERWGADRTERRLHAHR